MSGSDIPPRKIPSIGQAMLKEGVVNAQQLTIALATSDKYGYRLASALVMANILDEATTTRFLSRHHGVDGIILTQSCFKLDPLALVPKDVALKKLVLPLKLESRSLTVAMADPKDILLIDELSFMTGKRILPLIALEKSLKDNIPYAYSLLQQKAKAFRGKECKSDSEILAIAHYRSDQLEQAVHNLNAAVPQQLPKTPVTPATPPTAPAGKTPPPSGGTSPLMREEIPPLPPSVQAAAPAAKNQPAAAVPNPAAEYRVNPSTKVEVLPLPAMPSRPAPTPMGPAPKTGSAPPSPLMREEIPPLPSLDQVMPRTAAPADQPGLPLLFIVDDDKRIQTALADHLRREYNVHTADDGHEAVAYLKTHHPDLIIMDGMLPGIHGFELCKQLKSSPNYKNTPIIVASGKYSGWEYRQDIIRQYGADEFVEKPFNLRELDSLIQRLLKDRAAPVAPATAPSQEQQILTMLKDGKLDEALKLCISEAARDPLNAEIHYLKGVVLEKRGADFEAIEELEKAASIDPKHFNALRKLATLYQKRQLLNKAMETWMRAASAAPNQEIKEKIKQHLIKNI